MLHTHTHTVLPYILRFWIIIGTLLGFLVFYGLYLWCCTEEEEEEEKEVVAPEENVVEQGGVVKVLTLPRV